MPGPDLNAWLMSLMPNQGAGAPYGASGYPDNLPPRPYGPPGGGLMGLPGATPGAPSMGYPAMGQPGAPAPAPQPAPQAQPDAPWLSIGGGQGRPPWFSIGPAHPENVVNPDFWHDLATARSKLGGLFGGADAAPAPAAPEAGSGDPADLVNGPGGISSFPAKSPSPYGTGVYPAAAGGQAPESGFPAPRSQSGGTPAGSPSATPRPAGARPRGPLASSGDASNTRISTGAPSGPPPAGRRVPGAPDLGYYQPNKRFGTVQYQAPNSVGSRAPIYTTLNLFGGGR